MALDPSIFKSYDIRGIYPDQLDDRSAYDIARAYATLLQRENPDKQLTIAVCCDMRLSSPALKMKTVEGLTDSGVNVVDFGMLSTPTYYFGVAFFGYDGGIQISASHNPKEYNGCKPVRARSTPISKETGLLAIKDIILKQEFIRTDHKGVVSTKEGITQIARQEQAKDIPTEKIKPLKIVADAANAMGALDVEAIFSGLPCELVKLNFTLDGTFPVHQPDPLDEKNLKIVQDAVREHHADLGIAPDGDGDRYFFIDNNGDVVRQEIVRGIMARLALREHPGATVAYDIRPGRITKDMIDEAGGHTLLTPVGHALIKAIMVKENAVFGGESSGHYYYQREYGTFEMPIVFVLKFLVWLSEQNKPLTEAIAPLKKYFHSGEINSTVPDVQEKLAEIQELYKDGRVNLLDGVTVEYPDFWFNVRGSNTEPLIRLNLEARSKKLMEQKRDEVLAIIRS